MNKRFHLVITETIANENFIEELKDYESRSRYGNMNMAGDGYPQRDKVIKLLEVTVTETEFYAIKKAALETMA